MYIVKILFNPWSHPKLTRARFTNGNKWSDKAIIFIRNIYVSVPPFPSIPISLFFLLSVWWSHLKKYLKIAADTLTFNVQLWGMKSIERIDKGNKKHQISWSVRRHYSWLALQSETWLWVWMAARLGQFQLLLKTQVIFILNFTRPLAITYTNDGN